MKVSYAIGLVFLAAATLMGLGVLFLHLQELVRLNHNTVVVLSSAVSILLLLLGVFLGIFLKSSEIEENMLDKAAVKRLKAALLVARKNRLEVSRDRLRLRQHISALEEKLREYTADPLPPAENAEMELTEEDLHINSELDELAGKCDKLRRELSSRKERMFDLQAELLVAQTEAEAAKEEAATLREKGSHRPSISPGFKGESLTEVLNAIVALEGVRVALVADDQGLVVDTAGENLEPEALAAVTGLVAELSPRVTDLLPLDEIVTVALGDRNGSVMVVRYFEIFEARCALSIIRDEAEQYPQIAKRAVETIIKRLS